MQVAFLDGACITHIDILQHVHRCMQHLQYLNIISPTLVYKLCLNTAQIAYTLYIYIILFF